MFERTLFASLLAAVATLLVACTTTDSRQGAAKAPGPDYDKMTAEMMQRDFRTRGQAEVGRLKQDEVQAVCTKYPGEVPKDVAEKLQSAQMKLVKFPADGKFLGDWRQGERIAQTGVGKQWSDDPKRPGGGNCYACHQLSAQELSFGTIGPSLQNYGKLRGNSKEMLEYTWGKLWNSQAYSACSNMPRFGHAGILTEEQIQHVMALLFDPASPVNH